jgi:hypothetical protein
MRIRTYMPIHGNFAEYLRQHPRRSWPMLIRVFLKNLEQIPTIDKNDIEQYAIDTANHEAKRLIVDLPPEHSFSKAMGSIFPQMRGLYLYRAIEQTHMFTKAVHPTANDTKPQYKVDYDLLNTKDAVIECSTQETEESSPMDFFAAMEKASNL